MDNNLKTQLTPLEREIARKLSSVLSAFSGHLMEIMADISYDVSRIPPEVWAGLTAQERQILIPFFEKATMQYAQMLVAQTSIGVDWLLINQNAANWAREHAGRLITGLDDTTRARTFSAVEDTISTFFETPMTHPQLVEALLENPELEHLFDHAIRTRFGYIYGPQRAAMIATTETTRAASEGQHIAVQEIENAGVRTVAEWTTVSDDMVCPICAPLNGAKERYRTSDNRPVWHNPKTKEDVGMPPAHVNCRCAWGVTFHPKVKL